MGTEVAGSARRKTRGTSGVATTLATKSVLPSRPAEAVPVKAFPAISEHQPSCRRAPATVPAKLPKPEDPARTSLAGSDEAASASGTELSDVLAKISSTADFMKWVEKFSSCCRMPLCAPRDLVLPVFQVDESFLSAPVKVSRPFSHGAHLDHLSTPARDTM